MDENMRRYYLDVMGIQCWESLAALQPYAEVHPQENTMLANDNRVDGDRDVASLNLLADISNWPLLESAARQCKQCQLHKTRKQAILGQGNQSAELMIILLSPEMSDDAAGLLCSGEAYELLSKMLGAIDIQIDEVYLTSLLKCAVPVKHTISSSELYQCDAYLQQQIRLVQPRQVVVLGEIAARCLLQKNSPMDELRALINSQEKNNVSIPAGYESVSLLISYSPQELLQQPANKRKAWRDLQQLQKMMQGV
jgi:uracil-DNA glycosylase